MAIIFIRPDSKPWVNSVWLLTRFTTTKASAWKADRSMATGMPVGRVPRGWTSMEDTTGHPMDASQMPARASTWACPSAVAAPWLPMAGNRKGR